MNIKKLNDMFMKNLESFNAEISGEYLMIQNSTIQGEALGIRYKGIPIAVIQYDPMAGMHRAWIINGERSGENAQFRKRTAAQFWVKGMLYDTWAHTLKTMQQFPD